MKHALIIGSNSDIATEVINILSQKNWKFSLVSKNFNKILEATNKLLNKNIIAYPFKLDIEQYDKYNEFISQLKKDICTIIITVGYLEYPEKNKDKILSVNYYGPKLILEKILNENKLESIIRIVVITSVAADRKNYKETNYSIAKYKLSTFIKELQRNYRELKIIEIKPGYVRTKMTKDLKLPFILLSSSKYVAKKIVNSFNSKEKSIYVPYFWKYIVIIYNFFK